MQYNDLVWTLQELERKWRGSPPPVPSHKRHPSHSLIRPTHNIQYFACDNTTAKKDLPVVVTVGINYTQGKCTIPDQTPHFLIAARSHLPLVEDRVGSSFEKTFIASFNRDHTVWQQSCLASMTMKSPILARPDFHLVMINLSPWITNTSWGAIDAAPGAGLLISPPHCLGTSSSSSKPFDHLDDFHKMFSSEVTLWIGHGLAVVAAHFLMFVQKHHIGNWLLTANTASGCKPNKVGSKIKFERQMKSI